MFLFLYSLYSIVAIINNEFSAIGRRRVLIGFYV